MNVKQVEDFFCRNLRKKNKKDDEGKERPNHFYSKVAWCNVFLYDTLIDIFLDLVRGGPGPQSALRLCY